MSVNTFITTKLKGSENYELWSRRMSAYLRRQGFKGVLESDDVSDEINECALADIELSLDDGPLFQCQSIKRAHLLWIKLQDLYTPKGFSADFYIIREFFNCKLSNFNSMNDFLNTSKRLLDSMTERNINLPKKVIFTQYLNNLSNEYENMVANIMQSLRNNFDIYSLDELFSNLLDEANRLQSKAQDSESALVINNKKHHKNYPPKSYKIVKNKYCRHCKRNNHNTADCFDLFPEKAPKKWKKILSNSGSELKSSQMSGKSNHSQENDVLVNQAVNSNINVDDMEIDVYASSVCLNNVLTLDSADQSTVTLAPVMSTMLGSRQIKFVFDTAATSHIVCDRQLLYDFEACSNVVKWGNAKRVNISGKGIVKLLFRNNPTVYTLLDCLYMPELGLNIISHPKLQSKHESYFRKDSCYILSGDQIVAQGTRINNLYYLDIDRVIVPDNILSIRNNPRSISKETSETRPNVATKSVDVGVLHNRMGHVNPANLVRLVQNTSGFTRLSNTDQVQLEHCEECLKGKFTNNVNKTASRKDYDYLEKVSSDICGPLSPCTFDKYHYFITFMDIRTRYLEVKLLRSKDEAYEAFAQFANLYENNANNKRIRILATDNGTEYVNKRFRSLLDQKGIVHQLSPAYTKEPNGIIERVNRTLVDKVRCLLAKAKLPLAFWGEACLTAAYLYNRTPHSSISFKTPYEMKHSKKPDISHIRTFGSLAFYKAKGNHVKKLDDRVHKGVLVGFNEPLYKVYDISIKKCVWVRDIHIMENKFVKSDIAQESEATNLPDMHGVQTYLQVHFPNESHAQNHASQDELSSSPNRSLGKQVIAQSNDGRSSHSSQNIGDVPQLDQNDDVESLDDHNSDELAKSIRMVNNVPALKIHKTIAQSQESNVHEQNDDIDELALIVNINDEPSTYKQAMCSAQKTEWQKAMQAEIDELEAQQTWSLTTLPQGKAPLRGRWVYKVKTDLNGNVVKYKARWVVKGFSQILGIDYLETFSTTCRPESYRIIFILAMHNGWRLTQFDVKNAFIHAKIDKEIYVEQPVGFEKSKATSSCRLYCKLNKALYGLKQSPRLWYEHLLGVLQVNGFDTMPYDSAIFIHPKLKIIIICHVDDLIITGPEERQINVIVEELTKSVKLEKIGNINQFLGMQVETDYLNRVIRINQNKYTDVMLTRFSKKGLHPVTSPVEVGVNLEKSVINAEKEKIKLYQQQVGSLIYLAINSRPDICFAVNRCARYMSNPNESHFRALDRIWKYLNKYPELGLTYDCSVINRNILGYTDADWGGDSVSRKSTSGYIFMLNNNIISWLSMQQKTVALSSCEAEYMAFKEAIKENIYLNNVIKYYYAFLGMGVPEEVPKLLTDSESAMKLANNPEFHKRSKHIDITYHFIRDTIKQKQVELLHVRTKDQKADGFTKGLDTIKHNSFLLALRLKQ